MKRTAARAAARTQRRIAVVAYPGAQILDVTGPLEVFARRDDDAYTIELLGREAGPTRQ
jgi:hypothetical protein